MTIALLGLPTKEMAQSGGESDQYFDEEGGQAFAKRVSRRH